MCRNFQREINFEESGNESGWKESDNLICGFKRLSKGNSADIKDILCSYPETQGNEKCENFKPN